MNTYVLLFWTDGGKVETRRRVFQLKPGFYVYVGSAKYGAIKRIKYHERGEKKRFWHIDFVKKRLIVAIAFHGNESTVAGRLRGKPVPGFGCSDTKDRSHLFWYESVEAALSDVFHAISKPGKQESTPPRKRGRTSSLGS